MVGLEPARWGKASGAQSTGVRKKKTSLCEGQWLLSRAMHDLIYVLKRPVWLSRKPTAVRGYRSGNGLFLEGSYLVIQARAEGGLDHRSAFPNLGTNDLWDW